MTIVAEGITLHEALAAYETLKTAGMNVRVIDAYSVKPIDAQGLLAAAAHGSTVVAVVDRRPPLVVSNDGGATWREAGAGLAPGVAIAISPDHPDVMVYATAERLHVSRDGGRFWTALAVELPEITSVAFTA